MILGIFIFFASLTSAQELTYFQEQARMYRNDGLELQKQNNLDAAMSNYQKAVLLDPDFVDAYNDLGIIYEAAGQIEKAKEMYLKAIEIAPNYPNSYSNLALLYESQKDYAGAILCWVKRAVVGNPADPWAEAARKRLEDIARLVPEAYSQIGNQSRADLQQLGTKVNQYPAREVTLFNEEIPLLAQEKTDAKTRAMNYLEQAKRSFYQGQYVTALKEATTAEYLDPTNPEISVFVENVRKALLK